MSKYLKWLQECLDEGASVLGIMLGIIISLMNLIYSNQYLITIGPMLIITCGCYLFFRNKLLTIPSNLKTNPSFIKIARIIFCLSFALSLFILRTETLHRPLMYFILTAISASMIALQIVYSDKKKSEYLILLEIFLITASVVASAFYVFPSLPGVDPWGHLVYIQDFVNFGHIESSRGWIYYLNYPITHLNAVSMQLITSLDFKTAMLLGIGLPLALSTMFVFLIGRSLANVKVGLLAALLVNLSDVHLQFNIQLMPTSLGIALFTIIFYLLFRNKSGLHINIIIVTILFALLMIITHNMSSFVLFIGFVCLLIGNFAYNILHKNQSFEKNSIGTPVFLILFIICMIAYWNYAGYIEGRGFFESIVQGLINSLSDSGFLNRPVQSASGYSLLGSILNITGYLIFYFWGTLGILLWLTRQHLDRLRFALIVVVVFMTALALVFPLLGMRNILPYRWYAFIYVPLSILASFALVTLVEHVNYSKIKDFILCLIISIFAFFMITNSFSNVDSLVYTDDFSERLVFTESEIAAGKTLLGNYDGLIVSDSYYNHCILDIYLGRDTLLSDDIQNIETVKNGMVIWRNIMAYQSVSVADGVIILGNSYDNFLEYSHNCVYSDNAVKAFLSATK